MPENTRILYRRLKAHRAQLRWLTEHVRLLEQKYSEAQRSCFLRQILDAEKSGSIKRIGRIETDHAYASKSPELLFHEQYAQATKEDKLALLIEMGLIQKEEE